MILNCTHNFYKAISRRLLQFSRSTKLTSGDPEEDKGMHNLQCCMDRTLSCNMLAPATSQQTASATVKQFINFNVS